MKILVKYGPDDPDTHELTLKQLNLMCHKGTHDVHIVGTEDGRRVVVVQSPDTVERIEAADGVHWAFWAFWEFTRAPGGLKHLPHTFEEIKRGGRGFKHLAGLVDLWCHYAFDERGVLVHFRYPESHLHPDAQCALGDLLLAMNTPWRCVVYHLTNGRKPMLAIPKKYICAD